MHNVWLGLGKDLLQIGSSLKQSPPVTFGFTRDSNPGLQGGNQIIYPAFQPQPSPDADFLSFYKVLRPFFPPV